MLKSIGRLTRMQSTPVAVQMRRPFSAPGLTRAPLPLFMQLTDARRKETGLMLVNYPFPDDSQTLRDSKRAATRGRLPFVPARDLGPITQRQLRAEEGEVAPLYGEHLNVRAPTPQEPRAVIGTILQQPWRLVPTPALTARRPCPDSQGFPYPLELTIGSDYVKVFGDLSAQERLDHRRHRGAWLAQLLDVFCFHFCCVHQLIDPRHLVVCSISQGMASASKQESAPEAHAMLALSYSPCIHAPIWIHALRVWQLSARAHPSICHASVAMHMHITAAICTSTPDECCG